MTNIIKAEFLKQKKTFGGWLVWIAPLVTLLMAFALTLGMTKCYAESAWNWWYTLLLPGMLAILSYLNISKEKKVRYFNQTTLAEDRKKLMLGKIIFISLVMLCANALIFAGATLGGALLGTDVPAGGAALAVLLLTAAYLWEIPLYLFLSARFGMVCSLLVCVAITVAGVLTAPTKFWPAIATAAPVRIMCPVLHIMPNGLKVEAGSSFLSMGVIVPGILICLVWFALFTFLFLKWFDKTEVK